jgi:nitrite reductase/ring-hydroxylating ferredoxin subunit
MKSVEIEGREIVICNWEGRFYALDRRCGHMSAPLERGTLAGTIVTCAMHCAQFDAATGEALSGPVPPYLGGEVPPPRTAVLLANVGSLMEHVRTQSVRAYEVRVESEWVMVALGEPAR